MLLVDITQPKTKKVNKTFAVDIEVEHDTGPGEEIKLLVVATRQPLSHAALVAPWPQASSCIDWRECTRVVDHHPLKFHVTISCNEVGAHFIRARASVTHSEEGTWKDWTLDENRIEIIVQEAP